MSGDFADVWGGGVHLEVLTVVNGPIVRCRGFDSHPKSDGAAAQCAWSGAAKDGFWPRVPPCNPPRTPMPVHFAVFSFYHLSCDAPLAPPPPLEARVLWVCGLFHRSCLHAVV